MDTERTHNSAQSDQAKHDRTIAALSEDGVQRRHDNPRELDQLIARAFAEASQGILITSVEDDMPIVFASKGFHDITGYSPAEVLGRNCRFLQGPETSVDTIAKIRQAVAQRVAFQAEILNYRRDGTKFWNSLTLSPVTDDTGKVTHFVGTLTDVTHRRGLEEQVRQSQKLEAMGQLAGGVAHDFNNLIFVVNAYSEQISSDEENPQRTRDAARVILDCGSRAATLTRQLLLFSRNQIVTNIFVDIVPTIRELQSMLRRLIGEDVELHADLGRHTPGVLCGAGQIEQILTNLIVNARDAMPRGGTITIRTMPHHQQYTLVTSHTRVEPGFYALIEVTDTGCGMTPETLRRIFEPFFTTKGAGAGTGLGLPTVYGIIKQAGGAINVNSTPGVGTTFQIYFPAAVPPSEPTSPLSPDELPTGTERILLVEDDSRVREVACAMLTTLGYSVEQATNPREAIELAARIGHRFDCLVTDVVMPRMSGRELAQSLRAIKSDLRVLFISGYTDDSILRHGVATAEIAMLNKPFTLAQMAVKLREVLDA
jgi:two-component system cell cycle sensor histidine kinase/response regulator CckA